MFIQSLSGSTLREVRRRTMECLAAMLALNLATSACAEDKVGASAYGPADEVGALNVLTDSTRLAVLQRIASGKIYDLSVESFPGMPGLVHLGMGDPEYHHWMTHTPEGLAIEGLNPGDPQHPIGLYDDAIIMSVHTGTHIDALNHAGYGDQIYNGFKRSEHLGNKGWKVAGADRIPAIITRGVLIDVAGWKKLNVLPPSYEITPSDLEAALAAQGTSLQKGDAVFIRTGRMTLWPDPTTYVPHEPGIAQPGAAWLIEHGAVTMGADTIAFERLPIKGKAVHSFVFAERGVTIMENVWLEDLASDRCYEFVLFAAPIKLRGATGAPIRPFALPIKITSK
ncbi:MAG: cyclase family protein [Gammaproteobacteria bacterium]|nr:cyclase family protein [Gammaproteobacteria bacterium]